MKKQTTRATDNLASLSALRTLLSSPFHFSREGLRIKNEQKYEIF